MTSQQTPPAVSILESLPLPKVSELSEDQLRGAICVWCPKVLTAETARDLGERPSPDGGTMFPRSCQPCVRKQAVRVHNLHTRSCQRCADNAEPCPTRRALHTLAMEGRR